MDLTLTRIQASSVGIFGTMTDMYGDKVAETLEHAYTNDSGGFAPKVPAGTYKCVRRHSPRFGIDVFMLENVPGATFIEIHPGNYNKDSDGCILVGEIISGQGPNEMISQSRLAFESLMQLQSGLNAFVLMVVGP